MNANHPRKNHSQKPAICLWAQAGMIDDKVCQEEFQCESCQTDSELRKIVSRSKRLKAEGKKPVGLGAEMVFWKDRMRELPLSRRLCLHHMKGRIDLRTCTNDYNCINCEFDQYFQDQYSVHAVLKPVDLLDAGGFKIPQGYYFHKGHLWAKVEAGSEVRIGVDDFTLKLLGLPDKIETPLVGKQVRQGQGKVVFTRGANAVALLSPVSGVVTAVNNKLRSRESCTITAPYTDGWVMRVHATELRKDIKNLRIGSEEKQILTDEINLLYRLIQEVDQPLAADGGLLGNDLFGKLPQLGWERLVKTFFS